MAAPKSPRSRAKREASRSLAPAGAAGAAPTEDAVGAATSTADGAGAGSAVAAEAAGGGADAGNACAATAATSEAGDAGVRAATSGTFDPARAGEAARGLENPTLAEDSPGPGASDVFTTAAAQSTSDAPTAPPTYFANRARRFLASGLIRARCRSRPRRSSLSSNTSSSWSKPRRPNSATGGKLPSSAAAPSGQGSAEPAAGFLVLADTVGALLSAPQKDKSPDPSKVAHVYSHSNSTATSPELRHGHRTKRGLGQLVPAATLASDRTPGAKARAFVADRATRAADPPGVEALRWAALALASHAEGETSHVQPELSQDPSCVSHVWPDVSHNPSDVSHVQLDASLDPLTVSQDQPSVSHSQRSTSHVQPDVSRSRLRTSHCPSHVSHHWLESSHPEPRASHGPARDVPFPT